MPFDRDLSLAIDSLHGYLDYLSKRRGLRAWALRLFVRWQLRRLERHVLR